MSQFVLERTGSFADNDSNCDARPLIYSDRVTLAEHIQAARALAHGRIEGRRDAAALLQINPHTLRARMRKLEINWTQFRRQEDD